MFCFYSVKHKIVTAPHSLYYGAVLLLKNVCKILPFLCGEVKFLVMKSSAHGPFSLM
jgi:hypothetical protein